LQNAGGDMEIETMNLMSIGVSMMKVVALITIAIAITGFAIYLAGIACLCFKEGRSIPAPRKLLPIVDTTRA
jgi:hypothetical protein